MATVTRRSLDREFTGKLHPTKLAHVVIKTLDLQRARDWYMKLLEASVGYENDMVCFVAYDDEHHRVGLLSMPGLSAVAPNSAGLEHISFTYASLGALLANYKRLKNLCIEPYWCINHGPTVSMYYRDPDGNKVETQHDVFNTAAGAMDFIQQHYGDNFMGIIFDPADYIARYEAGEPIAELVKRPPLPPGKTPWDMFIP